MTQAILPPEPKSSSPESAAYTGLYCESWGRYPRVRHQACRKVYWRDQLPDLLRSAEPGSLLPRGLGRSYGDSCLNEGRFLLDCTPLNRILDFDVEHGRVRVEAGVSLADLLSVIVPRGWFLPVTPGTKFVTIGGAIANDVHGKNHHRAGTFGCHVEQLLLYRSDADPVLCSGSENADLFSATIGGLGLTGVVGWAALRLKRIEGNTIHAQTIPFSGLDRFLELSQASDQAYEYTVAWLDCLNPAMRGVFFRGNHAAGKMNTGKRHIAVPFAFPSFTLSRPTVRLFNGLYFHSHARQKGTAPVHYEKFFYPLDSVLRWNLLYGSDGFVQYQCVLPHVNAGALQEVFNTIAKSGQSGFLAVLKAFGEIRSPGLLSFPRPGLTLALDLPMRGRRTHDLLNALDEIVMQAGGAVYPAKDARMSERMFAQSFPNWKEFEPFRDPAFSSSFWRRVAGE